MNRIRQHDKFSRVPVQRGRVGVFTLNSRRNFSWGTGAALFGAAAGLMSCASPPVAAEVMPKWVSVYDSLLQKYVREDGVRYRPWHGDAADRQALGEVVANIGNEDVSGWSKDARLAYYLNAYNAWILQKILESYPTEGPGGGGVVGRKRFFRADSITVAGEEMSFDDLENGIIRKQFDEPRIHFALNCASLSCPPLHPRAFQHQTLERTLDQLTRAFVNENPNGVTVTGGGEAVEVSKVFEWYRGDFGGERGVVAFINRFRDVPLRPGVPVSYQTYEWTLNESE